MRAQIDCWDPNFANNSLLTFDLKTRATKSVRLNITNYSEYDEQRIIKLTGSDHSFEREFYDMARSSFLKVIFRYY